MSRIKLPKNVKAKWIKALRSGKYKQGTEGWLYDKRYNAYCCLGVAQKLGLGEGLLGKEILTYKFLPKSIQYELAHLNDEGVPFEVIAGVIDEML